MQGDKSTPRFLSPDKFLNGPQPSGSGRREPKTQFHDKKRVVQFTPQDSLDKHRKYIQSGDCSGKGKKSQQESQKRKSSSSNNATPEKVQKIPGSGKIVDTLIDQWSKHMGQETPSTTVEMGQHSTFPDEENQDIMFENNEIKILQKKLQNAEGTVSSLYLAHEAELRSKEEIQKKMTENWETIEIINKYCNDVSESVSGFQQLHAQLSALYDNVISVQQSNVKKLEQDLENMKHKDEKRLKLLSEAERQVLNQEKRVQEMMNTQNRLQKQVEHVENKAMLEKSHLESIHTEEKLKLIKEQEELMSTMEDLKLQLKRIEEDHRCKTELFEEKKTEIAKLKDENFNSQNKIENLLCQTTELTIKNEKLIRKEIELSKQVQEQQHVSESLAHKEIEITKLEEEIFKSQNKIEDLLRRNTELTTKNEKLIQMEKDLSKQLEEQQRISESLEKREKEIVGLKDEIFKSRTKVGDLLRQNVELSMKNEKLLHTEKELSKQVQEQRHVSELLEQKEKETSKLNDENFNNQSKIEDLLSKTTELSKKNERLVQREEELSTELQSNQEQMSKLQENLNTRLEIESSLVKEFNAFENKFARQNDEYKKLQNDFTNVEKDLKKSHAHNVELEKEIRDLKNIHREEIRELGQKIQALEMEKQKIVSNKSTKAQNLESFNKPLQAKHKLEVSTLREEYESKLTEIKEAMTVQSSDLNKKNEENQSLREIAQQLKERNSTLETELQKKLNSSAKSDTRSVNKAYKTQIQAIEHGSKSTDHNTRNSAKPLKNKNIMELKLDSIKTNIELEVLQTSTQQKNLKSVRFDSSSTSKAKTFDDLRSPKYTSPGRFLSQGTPHSTTQLGENTNTVSQLESQGKKFFKSRNKDVKQYTRNAK